MFFDVIDEESKFVTEKLKPDDDIGRNQALLENIFCMFVCIQNRLPLILTGPPGCSKTLSFCLLYRKLMDLKTDKVEKFIKLFKQVRTFYYQGHLQSTT